MTFVLLTYAFSFLGFHRRVSSGHSGDCLLEVANEAQNENWPLLANGNDCRVSNMDNGILHGSIDM